MCLVSMLFSFESHSKKKFTIYLFFKNSLSFEMKKDLVVAHCRSKQEKVFLLHDVSPRFCIY